MDPTILATSLGKELLDSTKPQQGVFLNYIFLHWFGGKKMTIANEVVKAEAENAYELKRLEGKVTQQQIIQALQSADNEIEYQNLFGTMQKVLPKLTSDNGAHEVDKDKMKRLKDLSKEFSSDDMQEVIAGILAGEYNQPGSFSLKTMDTVKSLSKNDIELFQRFCGLVLNGYFILGDFTGANGNEFRQASGLQYTDFLRLQELGLFAFRDSSLTLGLSGSVNPFGQTIFEIGGKKLFLRYTSEKRIGIITLTIVGTELRTILEFETPQLYLDWINDKLKVQGFETEFLGQINN